MKGPLEIKGDVGIAVKAEDGAEVHIHVTAAPENKPNPINRAVHLLLKTCDEANCRQAVERISQSLYGSAKFKDLCAEDLEQLQCIAEEIKSTLEAQQMDSHAAFQKEMDEYEEFFRRTGIRASKLERAALTRLMIDHAFNPRQIKKAWGGDVLRYEGGKLQIRLPVFEPLMGTMASILSIFCLVLIVLKLFLIPPSFETFWHDALQFALLTMALILSVSTMIAPAYIGKRIKAAID